VDVVTFEFENIPRSAIEVAERVCPVHPRGEVLHICQNREREKTFLRERGFPHAPFIVVDSEKSLAAAVREIGMPSVLKTADFGYDGKGQFKLEGRVDCPDIWKKFGSPRGVLEKWIPFQTELSVVVARGRDGKAVAFQPSENIHRNHILDLSIVPARFAPEICERAVEVASAIACALDITGLLAVEFFLTCEGELMVNELAPRPHNSGHFTFDACATSQFEQQLRAVCGLPLGSPDLFAPVVMWNLLGDLWKNGEPDWRVVLAEPRAKLHLYGKAEARPGRKMGHVCILAEVDEALKIIADLKNKLGEE
jgi:5-(carboxyamino)imidazole ribonucleotide synthase